MSFAELGLSDKVLKAAEAAGYTSPTPIQKQAIPHVLARKDVLGIAQTGTGKTAAFTLPMLTLLETGRARARMPRTLILEPTRELAAQVEENFIKYGSQHKLSVALLIGGVSFGDQDAKITRGADVLIATPGRLLDHFERGKLLLTGVELLVIDEADRMLDMGFIPDIERIVKLVPFTRQTLFFSATMPPEIQKLADAFLHNPVKVEVARAASTASTIAQFLVSTGPEPHQKRATLRDLIRTAADLKNGIIFCNRKRDVATLHRSLLRHGFGAVALHGDMDQRARMQALDGFRNNEFALLVASDVAARGLDIPDVSHVFNYDMPFHAEDYVHRIGRTGRAGRSGTAFTLVARGDEKSLAAIESLIKNGIDWHGKPLSERTEEDDSFSAPDRGVGWRREDGDRRGGRNRNRRRSKGRDRERDHEQHHGEKREHQAGEGTDHRQQQEQQRQPHARHDTQRHDNNQRRDDRRDHQRRRDRYDNEPDVSVIGFGDHVPAFLTRQVPSSVFAPLPNENAERKPVTPVSMPPRDLVEQAETPAKALKPAPRRKAEKVEVEVEVAAAPEAKPKTRTRKPKAEPEVKAAAETAEKPVEEKKTRRAPARKAGTKAVEARADAIAAEPVEKPKATRRKAPAKAAQPEGEEAPAKPARKTTRKPAAKTAKKVPA